MYHDLFASLRQNRFWTMSDRPGIDLLTAGDDVLRQLPQVYVILFGLDGHQEEGIYSLRAVSDDGMPQDTIIVFESEEDAERYSCLLEVTMDPHTPQVYGIAAQELVDFCHERSYCCRLEPMGTLLTPPDYNVGLTDWERATKLRSGSFAVLAMDPDTSAGPASDPRGRGGSQAVQTVQPSPHISGMYTQTRTGTSSAMARYQNAGKEELDAIRRQLEALLPPDQEA